MTSQKSLVLNDDILCLILTELPVKQLVRLETVSQQFMDCVGSALKRKTGLSLGNNYCYNNNLIVCNDTRHGVIGQDIADLVDKRDVFGFKFYDLIHSLDVFDGMLQKCSNISSLYLNQCFINREVIHTIVTRCPRLQCLTFKSIHMTSNPQEWQQITDELSRLPLIHLAIPSVVANTITQSCFSIPLEALIVKLPSLKTLNLISLSTECGVNNKLLELLPKTIRRLNLQNLDNLDNESECVDQLIAGNYQHLEELAISVNFLSEGSLEVLAKICNNLNNLRSLWFGDTFLTLGVLGANIRQLKYLQKLTIKSGFSFGTDDISGPLTSLRQLRLESVHCLATGSIHFAEIFPQLTHLYLHNIQIICDCKVNAANNRCQFCVHEMARYWSQLPCLKYLYIGSICTRLVEPQNLLLFKDLQVLNLRHLSWHQNDPKCLYEYCLEVFANRPPNKLLKIELNTEFYGHLMKQFVDQNDLIPKNITIQSYEPIGNDIH